MTKEKRKVSFSVILFICFLLFFNSAALASSVNDFLEQGDTYYHNGQYDEAIEMYSKAIEVAGNNHRAYYLRSIAYSKEQLYDNALLDIHKAIEIQPSDGYYNQLGYLLRNSFNYNAAIVACNKAIELNPEIYKPYFNKALSLEKIGYNKEALQTWYLSQKYIKTDNPEADFIKTRISMLENNEDSILKAINSKNEVLTNQVVKYIDGIPVTGNDLTNLEAFDKAMVSFMKERGIPGGTLAVMKDGKILLAHGYGFSDKNEKIPVKPDTLMRIASITKPITSAAIYKLINENKISLSTKVFPYLGITPRDGEFKDPRVNDITIQQLLTHRGGWDRQESDFDPMFKSRYIAQQTGKESPANIEDIISYMTTQPLQFMPGTRYAYSNFGFSLLGRVIEKASGQSYIAYIQQNILNALDIRDVEIGRTLPQYRNKKEIGWYKSSDEGFSVFDSHRKVPFPDGGFYLEAMDSHGALIASSIDLVLFSERYWLNGEPRIIGESPRWKSWHDEQPINSEPSKWWHGGSLPGTESILMWRADGVQLAAIFNKRKDGKEQVSYDSSNIWDSVIASIDHW